MIKCADFYRQLHNEHSIALEKTCQLPDFEQEQAKAHSFITELESWLTVLANRSERIVLRKAASEYQTALTLLAIAHYRPAFFCLRSTLELGLATIEHSSNIYYHREWLAGNRDINWASLIDNETGVLSKNFCKAFLEDFADEVSHINRIAKASYRSCSEYVHGNARTDMLVSATLEPSPSAFAEWHDVAKSIRYTLIFSLAMRYLRELDSTAKNQLEHCLMDEIGHLGPVQQLLHKS